MIRDEFFDNPEVRFAVNADRTALQKRLGTHSGRVLSGRRKWLLLIMLAVIVVLIGALVLSQAVPARYSAGAGVPGTVRGSALNMGGIQMKRVIHYLNQFVVIAVLSSMLGVPVTKPIVDPRATLRTIVVCQGQALGTITVTDALGHTDVLLCGAGKWKMVGYPGQSPTEKTPWLVTITVPLLSDRPGLPSTCRFQVTTIPIRLPCSTIGSTPLIIELDTIPT